MAGCQYAHLSVLSAISHPGDFYFQLHESIYPGTDIAQFLRDLCELTQQRLLLIWDDASIPRSQKVTEWLRPENSAGRVQLVLLPAYSPPWNATEPVWAWLKGRELKNVCSGRNRYSSFPNIPSR